MKKTGILLFGFFGLFLLLAAQQSDVVIKLQQGQRPVMAIPDLRGGGNAQTFMAAFNQTLWDDIQQAGIFKMAPKTSYPLGIPQQPSDFKEPPPPSPAPRRRGRATEMVQPQNGGGYWIGDWASPPVQANYLAFGYTAVQNDVLVLYGWLFDLARGTAVNV